MKHLLFALIIFLSACNGSNKEKDKPVDNPKDTVVILEPLPTDADTKENLAIEAEYSNLTSLRPGTGRRKNWNNPPIIDTVTTQTTTTTPTYPTVPTSTDGYTPASSIVSNPNVGQYACIYVDFSGKGLPAIGLADLVPMTFDTAQIAAIMERIAYRFLFTNIVVTTSKVIFDNANINKRSILCVGNGGGTNPGYGGMTYGYAGIGSTGFAYIYAERMGGSNINIGELCSHEAGHAEGNLRHHVQWATDCSAVLAQYVVGSQMGYCYGSENRGFTIAKEYTSCTTDTDHRKALIIKYGLRPGQQ